MRKIEKNSLLYRKMGERIRKARQELNLSARKLIKESGVTMLYQIESGKRVIHAHEIKILAKHLHKPIIYFFGTLNDSPISRDEIYETLMNHHKISIQT